MYFNMGVKGVRRPRKGFPLLFLSFFMNVASKAWPPGATSARHLWISGVASRTIQTTYWPSEVCTEKISPEVLTVPTEPLRSISHSSYVSFKLWNPEAGLDFRIFCKRGAFWELPFRSVDLHEQTREESRTDFMLDRGMIDEGMQKSFLQNRSVWLCSRSKSELQTSASRCVSNGWPRQSRSLHHFWLSLFAYCAVEFTRPDLEVWNLQSGTLPIFAPASGPRARCRRKEFYYPEAFSYSSPQLNFATYEELAQQVVRLGWR